MRITESQLKQMLENGAKIKDCSSVSSANLEPDSVNEQVAKKEIKRFDTPVSIHIHSVRKRLTDADGASAKAVIDGIVKAGILVDDSPEYVEKVSYSQEKTKGEEKTIITIYEI